MFTNCSLKAVLVDMDGTLADGMELLFTSYQKLMEAHGLKGTKEEFDELTGPAIGEVLTILNDRHHLTDKIGTLLTEYQETLRETYAKNVPLFPGALGFLQYCKNTSLKLALVTSADQQLAHDFLQYHEIRDYFDTVTTPEGLLRSKPSPDIYQRALDALNVKAEEAVAIEDSYNGILASLGANIRTIHILHYDQSGMFEEEDKCISAKGWSGVRELIDAHE